VKRLVFAAFVAFWAFVAMLLALAALVPEDDRTGGKRKPQSHSHADVATHDNENSCWMTIEGKVYDVTSYLARHPTPASVLLPWCGRDATVGMRTKGHGRDHSPTAWTQLNQYLVGTLE